MNSKKKPLDITSDWKRFLSCGLLGALMWAGPDAEANWRVSPELGIGVEFDDNVFLNDVSALSASDTEYGVMARATFLYDTQLTDLTITPELRSSKFEDNSDLDSNDQFLKFNFKHDRQKTNFRLRGVFSSESVRTAERFDVDFDIEDPEEIPDDDTARVFDTAKRDRFRLAPDFTYELSQRTSLGIFGSYQETNYDDDVSLLLAGFADYSVGASLGYSWSERDTISIDATIGKYESDADFDSKSTELGVGYNRNLSERTRLRMRVSSDTSEDENGVDQTNPVGEVSIIHRYLKTSVFASYQRTTAASGSSELVVRDAFSLNISRDVSPKLTLNGGARFYTTQALDSSDTGIEERDYYQIRAMARWRVSRTFSLDLDYRYTDVTREILGTGDVGGDSNQVGLWLYWHPKPLAR